MSGLFLAFVAATAGLVALGIVRWLPRRQARRALLGLAAWLTYAGLLGYLGVIRDPAMRPPGPTLLVVPAVLFVILFLVRSEAAGRIAASVPLAVLVGAQTYRVGVELFFHQLWQAGLVPHMLTYGGANFDILIGLSAPVAAFLYATRRVGTRAVIVWNAIGLATLANIAVRAALTAPGPLNLIHAEVANLALGTFPYTYIPAFFAPLAVTLHVLAIRTARAQLRRSHERRPAAAIPEAP